MKKSSIGLALVIIVSSSLLCMRSAFAAQPNTKTNSIAGHPSTIFALEHQHGMVTKGAKINAVSLSCPGASSANQVIGVTEVVTNDEDAGQARNYWAFDNYTRSIQMWKTGSNTYCAVVNYYKAAFHAIAGQKSPGEGGILTGDEHGTFSGGYKAAISGQLDFSDPAHWPRTGHIQPNPVNYKCDGNGNCPGFIDWTTKYFIPYSNFTFKVYPWSWAYVAAVKADGVWTKASAGNSGDILDRD